MSLIPPEKLLEELSQDSYWDIDAFDDPKRAYARFDIRGNGILIPLKASRVSEPALDVQLNNISHGGVCFESTLYLEPGSVWRLSFEQHGFQIGSQPIVVRHSRLTNSRLYQSGCQFVIEPALLMLLGVEPNEIHGQTEEEDHDAEFLAPEDLIN